MNGENQNDDILEKMKLGKSNGLSKVLETILEQDENSPDFSDVLNRVDEEGVSKENMLDFLRKYNPNGEHDEMIKFLENEENPGISRVLKTAGDLNKEGNLEDFITFVKTGGVDPFKAGNSFEDPLFKILTKYKLLGKFPEIFEVLSKRPDLMDPEALLEYLEMNNINGKYDELIAELENFVKQNRIYPDLGENNKDHPLTKLIHKKMRNSLEILRDFNRNKAKAEKWMGLILTKNKNLEKLRVLRRLGEVAKGDQVLEQREINGKKNLLKFLKRGCQSKMGTSLNMLLNRKRKMQKSERILLGKLANNLTLNKFLAFMRLKRNKANEKYKRHVEKGFREKFWKVLIRLMNPGKLKAYLMLKNFKNEEIAREKRERIKKKRLSTLLVKKNLARNNHSFQILKKNMFDKRILKNARNKLAKVLVSSQKQSLRKPLDKLRQLKKEKQKDENDDLNLMQNVFKRANLRVRNQKLKTIKDLQTEGLRMELENERNRALLENLFGNGNDGINEMRKAALRNLKEWKDEERKREMKLFIWNKIGLAKGRESTMRALCKLRNFNERENLKMSMNSLFKWKIANLTARNETEREMDYLINLHSGSFLNRLSNTQDRLLRDTLNKLRAFSSQSKTSISRVLLKLINSNTMTKLQALQKLRTLNSDFNEEESSARRLISRLYLSLDEKKQKALNRLRQVVKGRRLKRERACRILKKGLSRVRERVLSQGLSELVKESNLRNRRKRALASLLRRFKEKDQGQALQKWSDVYKREKICKFNGKITSMCSSLRKNHKFEMKSAFAKWSQKEMRMKYQLMANFLASAQAEKQKETYIHMKILYMQKKFSTMCKVLGNFLEFVERRKRENKMYAFDALCLENPWSEKVPKLLACSKVMSAQMCFWKLKLTRHQFIKKRRQRGGGYKIDKLKLVVLEKIFTKKISQYFMQIQIGRPNKYL